jgi:hypothetical protein
MQKPNSQRVTARATTVPGEPKRIPHRARPGIEVLDGGRQPLKFGEFLVVEGAIDREQLFNALQLQDRHPEVKIGECAAALGYLGLGDVEHLYLRFLGNARCAL